MNTCPNCGAEYLSTARYCSFCGHALWSKDMTPRTTVARPASAIPVKSKSHTARNLWRAWGWEILSMIVLVGLANAIGVDQNSLAPIILLGGVIIWITFASAVIASIILANRKD